VPFTLENTEQKTDSILMIVHIDIFSMRKYRFMEKPTAILRHITLKNVSNPIHISNCCSAIWQAIHRLLSRYWTWRGLP